MRNPQTFNIQRCRPTKTTVSLTVTTAVASLLNVGSAFAEDTSWKQNFAACAGNSPYIDGLLAAHDDDHRPLMQIGEMQAWTITDENGRSTLALTTNDGLTIIGSIFGPQGEDISAALLATVPSVGPVLGQAPPAPNSPTPTTQNLPQQSNPTPNTPLALSNLSPGSAARLSETAQSAQTTDMQSGVETAVPSSAPITASQDPTPEQQAGMNTIFQQATEERIWFSAAQPNEGAPVVYMLADPECPHCQWTIDTMRSQILSGEIDLRIVFAPITGVQGFNSSLSILHAPDVSEAFMSHMTSQTRGTQAVTQIDPNMSDRAVVQGIVDNINWMRANRMPGVPFFLYMTEDGARFAFSELPSDITSQALPL